MEKSFDFGALLRNNEKKHKSRPSQFVSVQGGIQKRLENNLKIRKSTRLTTFDQVRNLAIQEASTPAKSDAQLKIEHRRQQLEKWKEEKEKKKKEAAAQKKKPFIVGAAHAPIKYAPPPAPPKPSTSGRVTRSQTAKVSLKPKPTPKLKTPHSFAPKNASFKPPELKCFVKLPVLALPSKTKSRKVNITFEPVIHKVEKQTHCKTAQKAPPLHLETRSLRSKPTKKATPKTTRVTKFTMTSSSSSEVEAPKPIKRIQTPGPLKSVTKSTGKGVPKVLTLSSTENSSSETDIIKAKPITRKSIRNSIQIISSTSQLSSESQSSLEDQLTSKNITDSEKSNSEISDIEFVSNKSPLHFDSTLDSGKNSDLETMSIEKNMLNKSFSSDVEIIESKTPRKSLSRSITDSGKSSDLEVIQKTPLNKRTTLNYVTPKNGGVPKSESNSEEKLRSPKTPNVSPLTPEQIEIAKKISPCVTLSRGKDKARKEMKWKMSEGMLDVDASDIDSVEHFRRQLKSEKARMTEMCETWEKIAEQTQLPEAVQEAVLSAVGQANLLMSKKLCQFSELVERCARPEAGGALVTPADLHGFWDMVFMQVENIEMRFKKLEELKAQNWVEKPVEVKKKVAKGPAKKTVRSAGNSRIKEMIAAARKAKKVQETVPEIQEPPSEPVEKTFDAGFFSVRSPVRSPRPVVATPNNKHNLLKAVLSSEAKRASASKNSASYAMLRASIMSKCADGPYSEQTTPQLTPINLYATPGRSILKSTNINSVKNTGNRSIKLVLFDDSELDTSTSPFSDNMYTARENNSSKIDGIEELTVDDKVQDIYSETIEKKTRKPTLKRQNAMEFEESVVMTRNQRKSLNKLLNPEIEDENEVRVTRTRKNTPKVEEITPRKSTRKTKENTQKQSTRKSKNETIDNIDLIELKTPKRSTRKKALQEVEVNVIESASTSKRMPRRRKTAPQDLLT